MMKKKLILYIKDCNEIISLVVSIVKTTKKTLKK
jgi:hypothetical protein